MGSYSRGWNYIRTPNLDALPGKLDRLAKQLEGKPVTLYPPILKDEEIAIVKQALSAIGLMVASLTRLEDSFATRSRPAQEDVRAVLNGLNCIDSNKIEVRKGYNHEMVNIAAPESKAVI